MNKVIIEDKRAVVSYNNITYILRGFNPKADEYWGTFGDDTTPEAREINIWNDEGWQANVYALKMDGCGSLTIDDNTCELIEVVDNTTHSKSKDWTQFSAYRKEGIKCAIAECFAFMDSRERDSLVEKMLNAVIKDIKETADWSDYEDDEYNSDDVNIAVTRVLMKKFHIEV